MSSNLGTPSKESPIPQRVLVIGGGPCGLVSLRNMLERGQFAHVELYERRGDVGGVWYFNESDGDHSTTVTDQGQQPRWPSPAYEGLVGNVLPEFLSFSGAPFPPPPTPHQPFPSLSETHEYLCAFAEPYLRSGAIKLNREVVNVQEVPEADGGGWLVRSVDWGGQRQGVEVGERWDAVVVAVGWYDNPVWPETDGLQELRDAGLARHAKLWRGPQGNEDKRTLVVGNANSGNDIAAQLASVAKAPVYQSVRRKAFPGYPSLPDERILMVAPVTQYVLKETPEGNKFNALLTDGTLLEDLDIVHIGTGYRPFPNFIHVLEPCTGMEGSLIPLITEDTKPNRVPSLHRFTIYAHNTTLGFVGAPMVYTPFIIADVVSTWLALAWRGEVPYPDTPAGRLIWEKERLESIDKWRASMDNPSALMVFNVMGAGEQGYASALRADVVAARPELEALLPVWNDEKTKLREAMFQLKFKALEHARLPLGD